MQSMAAGAAQAFQIQTLRGHTNPVLCLAFSADGKRLASGDTPTVSTVWRSARTADAWRVKVGPAGK
jgi:WD40 repeat protein